MARLSKQQLNQEAAELDAALSQLAAHAGWDYDLALQTVRQCCKMTSDSALSVTEWLLGHVIYGASITVTDRSLTISYPVPSDKRGG